MESIRKHIRQLLKEAMAFEFEQKGGLIIFSTDVNAVVDSNQLIAKIRSLMATIKNRMSVRKKVTSAIQSSVGSGNSFGFTMGQNFKGRFYDAETKKTFDEKSYTLEVVGITPYVLGLIARNICKVFNQKMVLVKDYETGKIYMEDTIDDGINPLSSTSSSAQPEPSVTTDYQKAAVAQ